jgi:hypothetical protein
MRNHFSIDFCISFLLFLKNINSFNACVCDDTLINGYDGEVVTYT